MKTKMRVVSGILVLLTAVFGVSLAYPQVGWAQNGGPVIGRQKPRETPRERRQRRIEVSRVGLNLSRVPSEDELRASGQVAGLLDPASPADHYEFAAAIDTELKKIGLPQGLETPTLPGARWAAILIEAKAKVQKSRDSTLLFAQAMQQWNADNYDRALPLMEAVVQRFPQSPWAPEALLHIADAAKFRGQPSRAMAMYDELLRNTSSDPETDSYEIHQKTKVHLLDLLLTEGRFNEARPLLQQLRSEDENMQRIAWADYWLLQTDLIEGSKDARLALRDCSIQTLVALANRSGQSRLVPRSKKVSVPSKVGLSLAAMQKIGQQFGMQLSGLRTDVTRLKSLPMPLFLHYGFSQSREFVAHKGKVTRDWKQVNPNILQFGQNADGAKRLSVGHFLLLMGVEKTSGKFVMFDPQRKCTVRLSESELKEEWTGRCLVPTQSLKPSHHRLFVSLPLNEMKRALGTGY